MTKFTVSRSIQILLSQTMMTKSLLLALLCVLLSAYTALAGTNAEGKLLLGAAHWRRAHSLSLLFPISTCNYYSYYYSWFYWFMCIYCHIGLAYLETKGKEEGVVTLPSGLMYKEIREGNGKFEVWICYRAHQHQLDPTSENNVDYLQTTYSRWQNTDYQLTMWM